MEAYCVKCKAKTTIQNEQRVKNKNGTWSYRGSCQTCGGKVYRIMGRTKPPKPPKPAIPERQPAPEPEAVPMSSDAPAKHSFLKRVWDALFNPSRKGKAAKVPMVPAWVYEGGYMEKLRLPKVDVRGAKPWKKGGDRIYIMERVNDQVRPFVPRQVSELKQNITPSDLYGARDWEAQVQILKIVSDLWDKLAHGSFIALVGILLIATFMLLLVVMG